MLDLTLDLDLTRTTAQDLEGEALVPVGKYRIRIVDVIRRSDPSPHLRIRYEVLAGTDPSGVGCLSSERFFLSDKAVKRLAILGHRLGLIGEADFGSRKSVDWSAAIGCELVVQVAHEEYEKQSGGTGTSSKWTYAGFWPLGDERAAGVPLAAAPAQQRKPAAAAAPAPVSDYSDI